MSILTGTLEGQSISNRGHSNYSLNMSGTLDVDGKPIEVELIGQYELPGGNPKGKFVITTGNGKHDRAEGVSWLEARFESRPREPEQCIFESFEQGGVFQGTKEGYFELKIESRKYGSMDDGWIITFRPN